MTPIASDLATHDLPAHDPAAYGRAAHDLPAPRLPGRRRLGEVLVSQRVLDEDQLRQALAVQADVADGEPRQRLGAVVCQLGMTDERTMAAALAEALGIEMVDLGSVPLDTDVGRLLPRAVSERYAVLVLEQTAAGGLLVATADPTNVVARDDVRLATGVSDVTFVVATETQVRQQLQRLWSLTESSSDMTTLLAAYDRDEGEQPQYDADETADDVADAPVVRLVNEIFTGAVRGGASDIHVEPQTDGVQVRYRVDGLLREVMTVPRRLSNALASRIKVVSGLDIAEKRRPQDGRTRLHLDSVVVDARISTLPTLHGEKVVVRLLARADAVPTLPRLGLDGGQLETLLTGLGSPQGLILITGPTGSGKTNTLYSAIQQLRSPERNIVTLEDPVEVQLGGINQVQVHHRADLTFARGLRAILRQDPDVVLVGEVRDLETADLAMQASLTGHLVLTTLHTNDAVSAVTRLVDMGVEPFLVASSLTMVVAQRLVRRPCPGCLEPYTPSSRTLALLGLGAGDLAATTPMRGRGCPDCGGTGYRGRTGIFEVLPVTAAVRRVLLSTPTEQALRAAARGAGMLSLRAAGLAQAHAGATTYEEVLRVTRVDPGDGTGCRVCERGVADDMVVCPWCATPIDRGHCEGCSRPLDPDWRVCPWCRIPAGEAAAAPVA